MSMKYYIVGFVIILSLVALVSLREMFTTPTAAVTAAVAGATKVVDDPAFDVHFSYNEVVGSELAVRFYHDSTVAQPVWIEQLEPLTYSLSTSMASPNQEVTLYVSLISGRVPRFRLHVGATSEVFEFGSSLAVTGAATGGGEVGAMATNVTSCGTLTTPGYYALTTNLSAPYVCITIGNNNISFDCQGNTIGYSSAGAGYGVYDSVGYVNTTIKNCRINRLGGYTDAYAIYLRYSNNSLIFNNTLGPNGDVGIYLWYNSNTTVENNTATSSGVGIDSAYGSNNIIKWNKVSSTTEGIKIWRSPNNVLTNNNASSNTQYGYYLEGNSHYANLTNNIGTDNSVWDFYTDSGPFGSPQNFSVINFSTKNNLISFTGYDIRIKGLTTTGVPADSSMYRNISKYLSITNFSASGWIFLNVSYNSSDVSGVAESTLKLYKYNASGWVSASATNGVDTTNNVVYANITNFGSTFAPLGQVPITCPYTISSPGYYNLTQNINSSGTCITIGTNNVVLDCVGYTINHTDADFGVYMSGRNNVTIKNCNIIGQSSNYGITLLSSSNNIIANNTVKSSNFGIQLNAGSGNTIANNTLSLNAYGIHLGQTSSSSNNIITNNNASSNSAAGIYMNVGCNNNTLANNTANGPSQQNGIYLYSNSNNTIANNTANSNTNYGIYLWTSSNNNLTNNNATNNTLWDLNSTGGSLGNTVVNFTTQQNLVSFTSLDIALKGLTIGPTNPGNYKNISKWLNATNNTPTSWLFLNFSYADDEVAGIDESSLRIWKYNTTAANWTNTSFYNASQYGVDNVSNTVYANITYFASTFAPFGQPLPPLGNLTCTVRYGAPGACLANETDVLHFSNSTNAHAELPNQTNYNYTVCCRDTSGINTVLNYTGADFLRLSNQTNAHVQTVGSYPSLAYIGGNVSGVSCNYRDVSGNCSATNETCLLTMSNTTNAHVANCTPADPVTYNLTVCCAFTTLPPATFVRIENDYTDDGPDVLRWDNVNNSSTTAYLNHTISGLSCRWSNSTEGDLGYNAMNASKNCTTSGNNITCSFGNVTEGTYTYYVACYDSGTGATQNANDNTDVSFGVDLSVPVSTILSPLAGTWFPAPFFTVNVNDTDPFGLSEINACYWSFTDVGTSATGNATRSENESFTITVGPTGNCTTQGANKCNVTAWCVDWAGNIGS